MKNFIFLFISISFSACSSFLPSNYILYKQTIKGNKNIPTEELEALYRQKVNRKLFYKFMPYASIYESSRRRLEAQRLKDSAILAEYAEKIEKNPEKQVQLLQELKEKRRKIGYIDFRLENERLYYDNLLQKALAEKNEKKYYKIKKKRDKKIAKLELEKEKGSFRMRVIGEPFSIYNPENIEKTRREMQEYLYTKGYFGGKVTYKADSSVVRIGKSAVKTINVTYFIHEGEPHRIDSIYYVTDNPVIDSLIKYNPGKLKVGQILERDKALQERERIEKLLLENGFYRFDKQYIVVQVDTSIAKQEEIFTGSGMDSEILIKKKNLAHLRFIINNPQKRDTTFIQQNTVGNALAQIYLDEILGKHIQYKVKNVYFVVKEETLLNPNDTLQKGYYFPQKSDEGKPIKFINLTSQRQYSPKILYTKILLRPNSSYRKSIFDQTGHNLSNLNLFKFRSIQTRDDKRGGLDVAILATPNDKFEMVNEIGGSVAQNVPGPFFNTSLKIRNLWSGCGILENNFLFSIDGQASFIKLGEVYRTTQISFNSIYIAPLLFLPGKIKYKPSINALSPTTRINAGIAFVRRPEYGRRNFRLALTYNWHKFPYKNFGFSPLDLNIINTYREITEFRKLLEDLRLQGNNLELSFRNSFITSTHFYYEYNNINHRQNSVQYYLRPTIELGGTTLNLFNQEFLEKNKILGLEYFKFWRVSTELRYYQPLSKKKDSHSKIATRLFLGVASPYGSSEVLPYEKFFFSGGNTMRGWIQRRLGPGSYSPPDSLLNVEKQGEISIEANIEWRFKLWSYFHSVWFLDVGNIWTLRDVGFSGGKFTNQFYKEFGIATGTGLRMDFTFLLIRIDLGLRVLDPARPEGNRLVLDEVRLRNLFSGNNSALLNIGIGYPF
ncbi:MAG: BamA/TamA family outer membrane protein [Raineya sp.]|nr:BamA/TamA family outer membrane protein [Raineya sp.]